MANEEIEFQIYVADIHEYNAGRLLGAWIKPSEYASDEELGAAIGGCLSADDHEHAIHDSEGIEVREFETTTNLMNISRAARWHGAEKVNLYLKHCTPTDLSNLGQDIADADRGEFEDKEAWAMDYIANCYDLDKMLGNLAHYFDYSAFARDAELNGDVTFIQMADGNIWAIGE